MATAHGAGLMLLPFMLGLCVAEPAAPPGTVGDLPELGHTLMMNFLAQSNLATALAVATLHTLAMVLAGLGVAWAVYRWLGLRVLRSAWLNLDTVWGLSLVVAGALGAWMAF